MSDLPAWINVYAGLDDQALAALANPGLVRRGGADVRAGRITLAASGEQEVVVSVGSPPMAVRLVPSGPKAARCPCPVAGVCVHIVAACLWARDQTGPAETATEPDPVLDEVLAWEPADVNKAVGIAAVRRVSALTQGLTPAELATDLALEESGSRLTVSWPEAPDVVVVRGAGVRGMLVTGSASDVAEAAWRLQAVVRVHARAGRVWSWPDGLGTDETVQPGQTLIVSSALRDLEGLVRAGLSHVSADVADHVDALGQRSRLEALPLLGNLLRTAAGILRQLAARDDSVTEADALDAVARAWSLAKALSDTSVALPPALVGDTSSATADVGVLVPLAARWWVSPTARGVTVWFLDRDRGRLESVTTGRAAGTDPSFERSTTRPLIWNSSVDRLTCGPVRLDGAERRADGTLNPTTRTTVAPTGTWADLDLAALARDVDAAEGGERSGFARPAARPRIIGLRRGSPGSLDLDEVRQEIVWDVRTDDRSTLRFRLDASSAEVDTIIWLMAQKRPIVAVTALDDAPVALWVQDRQGTQLISPTLCALGHGSGKRLRKRWEKLRQHRDATPERAPAPPLRRLITDVGELLTAAAATGHARLPARDSASLVDRSRQCREVGWDALASALEAVLEEGTPERILWAATVAGRVARLVPHH